VRFDDRLKTVMTQPVVDAHDRTVRWRQLVDLLSRPHDEIDQGLLDAALTMVRSGMRIVPKAVRAATARSIAGRAAEPRLLAIFAGDRLEVAAPLLAGAPLDEAGWAIVMKAASKEVTAFVGSIRGAPEPAVSAAPETEPEETAPSIGEIAARIERAKSRRDQQAPTEPQALPEVPHIPAGAPNLFRWECDPSGQIGWVEGAPRGALIGRSLPAEEGAPRELVRAFADRLPFDDAPLSFPAPALEGEWRLSGIPAFSPSDGRFLGYRGVARRDGEGAAAHQPPAAPGRAVRADAEALRETIHEIKTPLNAIIGFAEIIDGQYLGPAHRNYRSRAAEIVTQARLLLSAIEDLDFAARINAAAPEDRESIDLGEIIPPLAEELAERGGARGVDVRLTPVPARSTCLLQRDLAQRLLRRLLTAVIDAASAGEAVRIEVERVKAGVAISVSRPMATAQLSDSQLFDPSFSTSAEGEDSRLGLGFALRLVRGLAKLAGGDLRVSASDFVLTLPKG
jgi:signal transduction histidine kinase